MVVRRRVVSDESGIGLEAYESGRRPRPLEGLVSPADGLNCTYAISPSPELSDYGSAPAIDAHPQDALLLFRFLDPLDRLEPPRLRGQKQGASSADARLRPECGR